MIGNRIGWESGLRERRDLKRREKGKRMDRGEGGREHGQKEREGDKEAERKAEKEEEEDRGFGDESPVIRGLDLRTELGGGTCSQAVARGKRKQG